VLEGRGYRCLVLPRDRVEDPLALNHEVAVHVRGGVCCVPKPGQVNVLWAIDEAGRGAGETERSRYDFVFDGGAEDPGRFAERLADISPCSRAVSSFLRSRRSPTPRGGTGHGPRAAA